METLPESSHMYFSKLLFVLIVPIRDGNSGGIFGADSRSCVLIVPIRDGNGLRA